MDFKEINKIKKLIKERKMWLAENSIEDWNESDTIIIAQRYAKLLKLNKSDVISSVCSCEEPAYQMTNHGIYCLKCQEPIKQTDL